MFNIWTACMPRFSLSWAMGSSSKLWILPFEISPGFLVYERWSAIQDLELRCMLRFELRVGEYSNWRAQGRQYPKCTKHAIQCIPLVD
jgi:hypothetical protein